MGRRPRSLASALLVLLLSAPAAAAGGAPQPSGPSAVFVVLDAAGARYFGCYGNALPATPRIDAFAARATVFERAYAQAAWTLPSVSSFMTGRYPPIRNTNIRVGGADLLAPVLQRAGLRTAAFSESPYVTRDFGLATGFDEFREYFPYETLRRSPGRFERRDSGATVDAALAWVREQRGQRFFLYLHLLAPHAPYPAPPPFGGRFDPDYAGSVQGLPGTLTAINDGKLEIGPRDLAHLRLQYQENLASGDHQVGRLLDGLERLGVLDRAVVLVTSDHGEAFREHGEMLHNTTVYEEMVHVPLVVRFPPPARLPERFPGVVELRSIFPTLCETLGVASCPKSLAPSLFERVREARERPGLARTWALGPKGVFAALITRQHKLIVRAPSEPLALYDLAKDPGETTDLRASRPELVEQARRSLRDPKLEFFAGGEATVDPATRERLEALGYSE